MAEFFAWLSHSVSHSSDESGRCAKPSAFPASNPPREPFLELRARGHGACDDRFICQNSSPEISRVTDLAAMDSRLPRLQLAARSRRNPCIQGRWRVALLYICALVSERDDEIITFTRANKPSRASRVRSSQQAPRVSYCLYPLTSSS
jgi:hypothetical protein